MPRFTNWAGVVVDIPAELAERLGGYTPAETAADGQGADPDSVIAWLGAEESYHADVTAWLAAETAATQAVTNKAASTGSGRK